MNNIILKDKTTYKVEDGASISALTIIVNNFEEMKVISDSFTKDNLSKVKFTIKGDCSGDYENLEVSEFRFKRNEDDRYYLTISLKERNSLEIRLEELEKSQTTQNNVIAEMSETVYGEMDRKVETEDENGK